MSLNLAVNDSQGDAESGPPVKLARWAVKALLKRSDFLAAARARKESRPGFALQARRRADDDQPSAIRIGFTCSKKVGNAVARNRAKRRLREVARLVLPQYGVPGWDYVLIGRPGITAERSFSMMCQDLSDALAVLHRRSGAA